MVWQVSGGQLGRNNKMWKPQSPQAAAGPAAAAAAAAAEPDGQPLLSQRRRSRCGTSQPARLSPPPPSSPPPPESAAAVAEAQRGPPPPGGIRSRPWVRITGVTIHSLSQRRQHVIPPIGRCNWWAPNEIWKSCTWACTWACTIGKLCT